MTTPREYRQMADKLTGWCPHKRREKSPCAACCAAAMLREAAEMRTALEWMYATRRRMDSPAWVRAENKAREILYPADALLESDR